MINLGKGSNKLIQHGEVKHVCNYLAQVYLRQVIVKSRTNYVSDIFLNSNLPQVI